MPVVLPILVISDRKKLSKHAAETNGHKSHLPEGERPLRLIERDVLSICRRYRCF